MKKLLIRLIEMYQKHISKWLESKNINCKFPVVVIIMVQQNQIDDLEKQIVLKKDWHLSRSLLRRRKKTDKNASFWSIFSFFRLKYERCRKEKQSVNRKSKRRI